MAKLEPDASLLGLAADALGARLSIRAGPSAPLIFIERIEAVADWLRHARLACVDPPPEASKAAEWLLDNDYFVDRALKQIRKDMPTGFYQRLPALGGLDGKVPRVLVLAQDFLHATRLQVSLANAVTFMHAFQRHAPLTIGELWAFPTMLRIACIELLIAALTPMLDERVAYPFPIPANADTFHSLDATESVSRALGNLGVIAAIKWSDFFDQVSLVEDSLARDPAGYYPLMDFETRDTYRRAVETMAQLARQDEIAVAIAAIQYASASPAEDVSHHVGYWLIDQGRRRLEADLGIRLPLKDRIIRMANAHPGRFYFFILVLAALGASLLPALYLHQVGAEVWEWIAGLLLSQLPASVLALSMVYWILTRLISPRILPKLDCKAGLPGDASTIVAMPVIVAGIPEIAALAERMESHWMANRDPLLQVALLVDLFDAATEVTDDDEAIVVALKNAIDRLNRRHQSGLLKPFHLLLRPRYYNRAEGCWMAWERKRGKLEQFNCLLVNGDWSGFSDHLGNREALEHVHFVVTVDGDTMLPPGSVGRLVGTLAHPLNRASVDPASGRIARGYTIIQPRVEISPSSAERTLFARLYTGETAIDIYSRAVSDVYQDLFGAGIFVGKGIYDVRTFHAVIDGRIPENRILSHDLLEGAHGRAALATDIVIYEGFPSDYLEYDRRLHRWIRGDWQLLGWLWSQVPGPDGTNLRNRIAGIDRWKIFDNLRRSLVSPSLVVLLLAGWFVLPGQPAFWTALVILAPAGQLFIDLVSGLARGRRMGATFGLWGRISDQAGRWLLALIFMLHEALLSLHAITIALGRSLVTHRKLLEWTSAAHVSGRFAASAPRTTMWRAMWPASATALGLSALLLAFRPMAFAGALPLLLAWSAAPEIALWIGRPRTRKATPLSHDDAKFLRLLARRTWFYFESLAGPTDNWLPPDNYQGAPHEEIAHRTSPTNIGMLLLSIATAWDLGFLGRSELAARTRNLFDSMARLERYRGHFLNWYETRHLASLEPRYVSTVDSGNLAVALLAHAEALRDAAQHSTLETERWRGLDDILSLIEEAASSLTGSPTDLAEVAAVRRDLAAASEWEHAAQKTLLDWLCDDALPKLEAEGLRLAEGTGSRHSDHALDLSVWLDRLRQHASSMRTDLAEPIGQGEELLALASEAVDFAQAMEFGWLYDAERRLLHIGHNVSTGRTDTHYYDMLASEARLASFFAIAKGDLPIEHWFHLQRPITRAATGLTLVSWNGSMFEYLMPRLLLPGHTESLLGESERVAADVQRRYGQKHGVPWGISESAYAARDPEHRFRYQAFGVPKLGMRRGLSRDLVIAPYASALALAVDPARATANLRQLCALGAAGRFGLWEAVDYTPERKPENGTFAPVNAFMAHHQGMILLAIGNALLDDRMVARLVRDPQMGLVTLLLSERIPSELPSEIERLDAVDEGRAVAVTPPIAGPWHPAPMPFPQVHLLGNGRMNSWISESGGGGLRWQRQALTRFAPDTTRDAEGFWLYIHDCDEDKTWSATRQPTGVIADEYQVSFHPHLAEFHRRDHGIETRLEVVVSAGDDFEIRRVVIANESDRSRHLLLTSYAEVVLAPPLEDERHPAFSKLFVGGEFLPEQAGLLFKRRPRNPSETPAVLLHLLVGPDGPVKALDFECDRETFIGRNRSTRSPRGASQALGRTCGWTLDPIAALQVKVNLAPGEKCEFCFLTIAAATRSGALAIAERHATLSSIDWLLGDAAREESRAVQHARIEAERLPAIQALGSLMVYPHGALRASPETIRANSLGQSALWGLAISGDLPILLLRWGGTNASLVPLLIGAHQLWRRHGLFVDLVIVQTAGSAYLEPLRSELAELLRDIGASEMLGRSGGTHLVFSDQIGPEQMCVLEATAWAILDDTLGSLEEHLATLDHHAQLPPPILPSLVADPDPAGLVSPSEPSRFANGLGGLNDEGTEYVLHLEPGQRTPAPWSNVLANDDFGCLVTESGGGFSWSVNSGEHRLTPWTNDPVTDRSGEALYLRDEETTAVWSITPSPAGGDVACRVQHGAGYSVWNRTSHGIEQEMRVFVPVGAPVKVIRLRLRNRGSRSRRITATYYCEWLLGSLPSITRRHVRCEFDEAAQTIIATNPWNAEFAGRAAFLTASGIMHGFTTDREEFLGREHDDEHPAALRRWGLSGAQVAGPDACGAYQLHLDLAEGEEIEAAFVLGTGSSREEALALAERWRSLEMISHAEEELHNRWDNLLNAVKVRTPDPAFDALVNRWLLYQSLSSRIMARAGFYQASGAIGFRDQLQDVLALLHVDPARVRAHILACAAHQFEDGDVLHWWHPPAERGVRTRCSDDMLWLPFAAGTYVRRTGDVSILLERVPFLQGAPLAPSETDRYDSFQPTDKAFPLIDHCERALDRVVLGSHGLPLIGAGDWNDGMDRVGREGRGQSVWLGWFASIAAQHLADLEQRLGRKAEADHWAERATLLRTKADITGWDGEWYRRAFDDNGSPLGSVENVECRIDSISQSWAQFAGAPRERVLSALNAAKHELIDNEAGLARLLWPPFDKSPQDPGYIKAYPPGIRENGGQYSHAAAWLGLALAGIGDGDGAHAVFSMINPLLRSNDAAKAALYRIEPYAVAGDIAAAPPHAGRGGWSWYTGAAAWSWRLAVEGILGLKQEDGIWHVAPSLPRDWPGFEATLQCGGQAIELKVDRDPADADHYILTVDGKQQTDSALRCPASTALNEVQPDVPPAPH